MRRTDLDAISLPDAPGVYFFVDARNTVLYVGKATSIKSRVRSYFSNDLIQTRGPRIVDMVTRAHTVTFEETDSVLEALLLESVYIKKFQPYANTDGKDGKSFAYVVITKEPIPRILVVRGRELDTKIPKTMRSHCFGPFPHAGQLKEALRLIRKIFPFFDTKKPVTDDHPHQRGKILFNQQIGLYPALDDSADAARSRYQNSIKHIVMLFKGHKKKLVRTLERDMHNHAEREEFEEAARIKRQLFALKHIQDVSLIREDTCKNVGIRVEAYDIAHLSGAHMVGVMTVVEDGEVNTSEYRRFTIRSVQSSHDTAALKEVLERRLGHDEWRMPSLIVMDGGVAQKRIAERTLAQYGIRIPVVSVVKDERHRPKTLLGAREHISLREQDILLANAEAHRFALSFHRKKRSKLT